MSSVNYELKMIDSLSLPNFCEEQQLLASQVVGEHVMALSASQVL
jgi:hypothetical protein